MPERHGYKVDGGWAGGGDNVNGTNFPQNLTINNRNINGEPVEYKASQSIEFVDGFESGNVDEFLAFIADGNSYSGGTTSGSGGESNSFRYGFNGKENDDEVKGVGNQQDYGMRIYDPRLGKFLSVDPLVKSYPWYTPYSFAGNKPLWATDLDGAEEKIFNLNNDADHATVITLTTVNEVRNSLTNTFLRINPSLEREATRELLQRAGVSDKSMQAELLKNYVARVVTIVEDVGRDEMGNVIQETRREWALTAKNSAGTEFLAAALDVLSIASAVPAKGSPLLFAKGSGVVSISLLRKSFTLLYNVRKYSTVGVNNALKGVHAIDDVMEAGMAFVGENANKIYTSGGRFEGWISADGLKRFRPPTFKKNQGKIQANFEQRTSKDIDWDNSGGSKSNMHVDTDSVYDYSKERK